MGLKSVKRLKFRNVFINKLEISKMFTGKNLLTLLLKVLFGAYS